MKLNIDPKLAKSIEEDMAEIDDKKKPESKTTPKVALETVTCLGCRGTGLLDADHKCTDCNATGKIPAAEG